MALFYSVSDQIQSGLGSDGDSQIQHRCPRIRRTNQDTSGKSSCPSWSKEHNP